MRNILKIILTLLMSGTFATTLYAAKLYHPETGEKLADVLKYKMIVIKTNRS